MRELAHRELETLRLPNGLYVASLSDAYRYVWVRDTCYIAMSDLDEADERYEQTYGAILDIFRKYRWKIDYHVHRRPSETFEYVHPRYSSDRFEELPEPWGNAQNDAIGLFLFGVGQGLRRGKAMFRDEADREIVQELVQYLATLEYWSDADNGMWEESREVHASSIGACAAGLLALYPFFKIEWAWIRRGLQAVFGILPDESASKTCDLAQLSLIYPYRLLPADLASHVLSRVEEVLLRERGVARYPGDMYYREGDREAEWCLGLPWLGLCHLVLGDRVRALEYLRRTERAMPRPGAVPELYLAVSGTPNPNTPLGWAVAMYLQLYDRLSDLRLSA